MAGATGIRSSAIAAYPSRVSPRHSDRVATDRSVYDTAVATRVAYPLGGIGAGMICLEGTGALSSFSLENHPDLFNEPCVFAALSLRGPDPMARVLEGPVPGWKIVGRPGCAIGCEGAAYGLPRFSASRFSSRFPFGTVELTDPQIPLGVTVTGWSPFVPGESDHSSLPVAALEYHFTNDTKAPVSAVFSFSARNFLGEPVGTGRDAPGGTIGAVQGGFLLQGARTSLAASADDPAVRVDHAWFRGEWFCFDPLAMAWNDIVAGSCPERPPVESGPAAGGATLFVPFDLAPGEAKTIALRLSWYCPTSKLRYGRDPAPPVGVEPDKATYQPWYAARFASIAEVDQFWLQNYSELRAKTQAFTDCFYDTTLPSEAIEAVAANLSILKSPTTLRQTDGRLWLWEGSNDTVGSCAGSCNHVWNYAQAIPHLFPDLERTVRETDFGASQSPVGCQMFRTSLPIRPPAKYYPAADGQLGGIMKLHREWRISGDTAWLRRLWPKVRQSLDFCIRTWDPNRQGWIEKPHHNTYDIQFWGPTSLGTSFYLGALQAAVLMGRAVSDDVTGYDNLLKRGRSRMEAELFNGEYFIQRIDRAAAQPDSEMVPEERALFDREGPKYQYGSGCLSDGVIGAWMAAVCGVGAILDQRMVTSHATSVHRHNLKQNLSAHTNTQRPVYALGNEGGLLLCTWPKGGRPTLPFIYSDEVWTGIEYQVASHLMMLGKVDEGLEIVRTCRARYDGRIRNPYDEYECGHWYGRALSSYALLQGLSGARYDAVDKTLHLRPSIKGDFRAFLSTATGYGTVGVRSGQPFLETKYGQIEVKSVVYVPAGIAASVADKPL